MFNIYASCCYYVVGLLLFCCLVIGYNYNFAKMMNFLNFGDNINIFGSLLSGSGEELAQNVEIPNVPKDAVSLTGDNGLYKIMIKEGVSEEKPCTGSKVVVDYIGWKPDGSIFENTKGKTKQFNIGRGEVIRAWDITVASMKRGERCKIICAPKYGYGSQEENSFGIKPDDILTFEIKLYSWEFEDVTEDCDKGIIREIYQDGTDYITPNIGAKVDLEIKGKCNDKEFLNETLTFCVGEADDDPRVIPAIDMTVKLMKKGEHCLITVRPKYGYGTSGNATFNVPPNAELTYDLKLNNFKKALESWEMMDDERVQESERVKAAGTELLKEKKYSRAVIQYKKILDYLEYHDAQDDDNTELLTKWKELKLSGFLNLSLCYLKMKCYKEVILMCEGALKEHENSEKAQFRMGEAYFQQHQYNEAKKYFAKVLQINPDNKTASKKEQQCNDKLKASNANVYKGMFDKFSKQDEKKEAEQKK